MNLFESSERESTLKSDKLDITKYESQFRKYAKKLNSMYENYEKIGADFDFKYWLERIAVSFLRKNNLAYHPYLGQAMSEISKNVKKLKNES